MIDLYYAPTPNGWKISILLEECKIPYNVKYVNIMSGEQYTPQFLKISPNNRIPVIVDHDPTDGGEAISIFETGAIMEYIADKHGQFLPSDKRGRANVMQWLMWQMGGLGPMLGQHGHFKLYAPEKIPYAIDRYRTETQRLYNVLNTQLDGNTYVAGDYSIADMAIFPWVRTYKRQEIDLEKFPNVRRWYNLLKERPALRKGLDLGKELLNPNPQDNAKARKTLFGITDKDD